MVSVSCLTVSCYSNNIRHHYLAVIIVSSREESLAILKNRKVSSMSIPKEGLV